MISRHIGSGQGRQLSFLPGKKEKGARMNLVRIDEQISKEEKLNQILDYLGELKNVFAEVVSEFENEDAPEETVDMLTGALDAVEDAHDVILDVIEDTEEF